MSNEKTLNDLLQEINLHKNNANISTQNKGVDIATNAPIPELAPAIDIIKNGARVEFDNFSFDEDMSTELGKSTLTTQFSVSLRDVLGLGDWLVALSSDSTKLYLYNFVTEERREINTGLSDIVHILYIDDERVGLVQRGSSVNKILTLHIIDVASGIKKSLTGTNMAEVFAIGIVGDYFFACITESTQGPTLMKRQSLSGGAFTTLTNYSSGRAYGATGCALTDCFVCAGGSYSSSQFSDEVIKYSQNGVRTELLRMSVQRRSMHTGSVGDDTLIITGGRRTNNAYVSVTEKYNVVANIRSIINSGFAGSTKDEIIINKTVVVGDKLWFKRYGSSIYILNIKDDTWQDLPSSSNSSSVITAVKINGKEVCVVAENENIAYFGAIYNDGSFFKKNRIPAPLGTRYDFGDGEKTVDDNAFIDALLPLNGWIEYEQGEIKND